MEGVLEGGLSFRIFAFFYLLADFYHHVNGLGPHEGNFDHLDCPTYMKSCLVFFKVYLGKNMGCAEISY